MPAGFVGAILARVIGERVAPIVPVAVVVVVLAAVAVPLAIAPTVPLFVAGVIALAIGTLFSLPYFFAQLGAFDRAGRYTGFGPAMMLIGLAVGPSSAVMLSARFGLSAVGLFSAALLVLGGIGFAFASRGRVQANSARDYPFPARD
jgi:predicted MFS family arabinose efflux permease